MTEEEKKKPFADLFTALTETAAQQGAQVLAIAVYPAPGGKGITAERLNLVNPEVHEASAAWVMPVLRYLDIYFGDSPPTDQDYAMFNQIMISRKMQNMSDADKASAIARVQAQSKCPTCGVVGCTEHPVELN